MRHHTLHGLLLLLLLAMLMPAGAGHADETGPILTEAPDPLAPRAFQVPEVKMTTLSNGLRVAVLENPEVPMVWIRLVFNAGSWTDPAGQEGLASATMDMLDEGAGSMDALALSAAKRALASELSTYAYLDGAAISASCLQRNLEPTLDLLTTVLREPAFSDDEWELMRSRRLLELKEQDEHPTSLCYRALDRLLYGESYDGRFSTEESYARIGTAEMREWAERHLHPGNALLLVGGDITPAEIAPLLEARLGTWQAREPVGVPLPEPQQPASTVLFLMDKPDAPQSVIGFGRFTALRTDADFSDLYLANTVLGGIFTSRINLNLREDKGWTYGARSFLYTSHAPAQWLMASSVDRDATADAVAEVLAEVRGLRGDRPVTAEELEFARSNRIHSYPAKFERTGYLLGEVANVWRYDLPEDWIAGHLPRLRAVTLEGANAAAQAHLDPDALVVVVVGDLSVVRDSLVELGLPTVDIDRKGALLGPMPETGAETETETGAETD